MTLKSREIPRTVCDFGDSNPSNANGYRNGICALNSCRRAIPNLDQANPVTVAFAANASGSSYSGRNPFPLDRITPMRVALLNC